MEEIIWRGESIGHLTDVEPDMWYLDGAFKAADSELGKTFTELTSKFSGVMQDQTKGTRAVMWNGNHKTHIVVIKLYDDGRLLVRRIMEDDSIEWVLKNVPE